MAEDDVCDPQALALDNIEQVEVEVERLDTLNASKTKELDEIYWQVNMDAKSVLVSPFEFSLGELLLEVISKSCSEMSEEAKGFVACKPDLDY
ncbi:hypothetical protein L7F22_058626 [Adiantum nelumboides]|nr:hypothetical protein [Adiantum nelumboides]